jgi:hypothetical protein
VLIKLFQILDVVKYFFSAAMGKIQVVTSSEVADKVVQTILQKELVVALACTGVDLGPKGITKFHIFSHRLGKDTDFLSCRILLFYISSWI